MSAALPPVVPCAWCGQPCDFDYVGDREPCYGQVTEVDETYYPDNPEASGFAVHCCEGHQQGGDYVPLVKP